MDRVIHVSAVLPIFTLPLQEFSIFFAWPTWAWVTLQSRNGNNKAFVYYFDHRIPGIPGGANHAAEIPYVFGNLDSKDPMNGRTPTAEDKALHELIRSYWINFARNGDP